MTNRLLVFDVDGTLVDSQSHIDSAMAEAFRSVGRAPLPRADVLRIVGLSLPVAIARLAPDAPASEVARMVTAYKDAFAATRSGALSVLYPGARATVEAMAARDDLLIGIATGKSRRGLSQVLAEHGLAGAFVTEQTADHHPSKPHPAMLETAMAEAGSTPAQTVMLGDTSFDMEMARAAGARALGVAWGYHDAAALLAAGATEVLTDFDTLPAALDRLWAAA